MTETLHQDLIAGKLAWLPIIDDLKLAKDKCKSQRELVRDFERKDSNLAQLAAKLQDAVELVGNLQKEIGRAVDVSASLEGEKSAERKCSIHDAVQYQ